MPILYRPSPGAILLYDYWQDAQPPEMVKRRPVVVVSPRTRKGPGLAIVVPLSTTPPLVALPVHVEIHLAIALPKPFDAPAMWAKCDLPNTVAMVRLDRFRERVAGQRIYREGRCSDEQLKAVRRALMEAVGGNAT